MSSTDVNSEDLVQVLINQELDRSNIITSDFWNTKIEKWKKLALTFLSSTFQDLSTFPQQALRCYMLSFS